MSQKQYHLETDGGLLLSVKWSAGGVSTPATKYNCNKDYINVRLFSIFKVDIPHSNKRLVRKSVSLMNKTRKGRTKKIE